MGVAMHLDDTPYSVHVLLETNELYHYSIT